MQGENVELFWYAFWFTEGMILLTLLWAVVLFSKWLFRHFFGGSRIERRSGKHAIVLPFGRLRPPRSVDASQFEATDRSSSERKERIG